MSQTIGLTAEELLEEDERADRITARCLAEPDPGPAAPPWAYEGARGDGLPPDLADLPWAVALAMIVLTVDRSRISAFDLVHLLRAEDRLVSMIQSRRLRTVGEIARVYGDEESAAAEVAAALHLTRAASRSDVELAGDLGRHRPVAALLERGDIDLRRTRVLIDGVRGVGADATDRVLERVCAEAPRLTTGQLRSRLSRLCLEVAPESAQGRYRAGLDQRRIVLSANPDTTANLLGLDLPPDLAVAAAKRINWLARKARRKGDQRTLDQIKADVFLDLLTGRSEALSGPVKGAPAGQVDIVADVRTLTGESEEPGHLPGFGPVLAEIARKTVARQTGCRWEYIVTDGGRPVATGTIRRRPTAAMRRRIRAQHPTCVWPGCRMPARQADIDHRRRWSEGGPTTLWNLAPLCEAHHTLLDKGWRYEPGPEGDFVFVSPLGNRYVSSGRSP